MRRGQRDKWTFDDSPSSDPIVTVTIEGKVTTPKTRDGLTAVERDRLRALGADVDYDRPPSNKPAYVPRTYQRQTLPEPHIKRDLGSRKY